MKKGPGKRSLTKQSGLPCPNTIKKATIKVAVVMQIILFCPFDADVLIPYGRYWCSCAYGSHGHVHGDASLVETCASYNCTSY